MSFNSGTVTAATDATADQYNNLRKDVLEAAGEYVTSGGSANAQTFTISAQITAYKEGMVIPFKAGYTNTGACTGNVNAIGAKDIKLPDGSALSAGDITAGRLYELRYDGTNLILMNGSNISLYTGTFNTTATNATFTADAGTDVITSNNHNLTDGDKVVLTTTSILPGGLSTSTGYIVRDATTNTFKLTTTPYNTAINITDAGTGTHTWTNAKGAIKVSFSPKNFLKIILRGGGALTTGAVLSAALNTDGDATANNYGIRTSTDGGGASSSSNTTNWSDMAGGNNSLEKYVELSINNNPGIRKIAQISSFTLAVPGSAQISNVTNGNAVWDNSSDQITQIIFFLPATTAEFATGTTVYVYGWN